MWASAWPEIAAHAVANAGCDGISEKTRMTKTSKSGTKHLAVTFEQVRLAAQVFPGVEDSTSYGTPALKVRGKLLARVHQSGECFVLRTNLLDREILMQSDPQVFYITDHYRDYPWVLVRFSAVDAGALPELMERAWRLVAPKSLVAKCGAGKV
jgi:hypothetical protein